MGWIILAVIVIIIIAVAKSSPKRNEPPQYLSKTPQKELSIDLNFPLSSLTYLDAEYVVLDVETTGLPLNIDSKPEDLGNWPFVVQFSYALFDIAGEMIKIRTKIVKPRIPIPDKAAAIHHITTEIANEKGIDPVSVFDEFIRDVVNVKTIVAHNIDFDIPILEAEFIRNGFGKQFVGKDKICTMKSSTSYCCIPKYRGNGYKYPKLTELFGVLFVNNYRVTIPEAHDSEIDTLMTSKCFFELKKRIELKPIKGKSNWKPETLPLIYDPDTDLMEKPEFKRIATRYCEEEALVEKYEYYKKNIVKEWRKLYEAGENKIGIYGTDRLGHKARLGTMLDELHDITAKIEACAPPIKKKKV